MRFKGEPLVLTRVFNERSTLGAWSTVFQFVGVNSAIAGLVNAMPLGSDLTVNQGDGTGTVSVRVGNQGDGGTETPTNKWEIDRENVDKDIMYLKAAQVLSQKQKDEMRRWRADPTTPLNTTVDGATNAALMGQLGDEVRRGADSFQVSTVILKRTRTMSAVFAPSIVLTQQTEFYSTAKLTAQEGIPNAISSRLPTVPYAPPANAQWGWLPRNSNRTYTAHGQVEEVSDWIFAAWSTVLYAYVS